MHIAIEETSKTPSFKISDFKVEIEGRSIPEDAVEFYSSVQKHIETLIESANESVIFSFKFDYINSASKKSVIQIFKYLEGKYQENKQIVVNWYYEEGDDDMKESGQDLKELLSIPFNLLAI
jgi:hypothetical protein